MAAFCLILSVGLQAQAARPSASPVAGSLLTADESSLSLSQGAAGGQAKGVKSNGIGIWSYIQMFLVLALVVGSIYAVFSLIKKFNKTSTVQSSGLRVLATAGVGPGKAVHVVQAGKQAFLVGVADQSVSLIAELTDKEYVDALTLAAETNPPKAKTDFASILVGVLNPGGKKGRGSGAGIGSGSLDFLGKQRDRLRKL